MREGAIGLVGLGNMGAPMLARLRQNAFDARGYDLDPVKREAAGGSPAVVDDLRALASECPVLILMLPTSQIVRAVLFGNDGIAGALPPGAVVIDMGSSDATETVRIGEELEACGVALIDAPVSGGVRGANAGELAIMVGTNNEAAAERVQPILAALGSAVRVGGLGAGHAVKSLNNFLAASIIAATSEALLIAERFAIDPRIFFEAINASTGRSFASQTLFPDQIANRRFDVGFALALMAKDVDLAAKLAESVGFDAPFCALARQRWAEARDTQPSGADFTRYHCFAEAAGAQS